MPKDLHLKDWIKIKLQQYNISSFYYLAHKNNLEGILKYGILPKNEVIEKGLDSTSFAEIGVQESRDAINIALADKKIYNIHDMVPLYLTPKTPTLFARKNIREQLFFSVIQSFILTDDQIEFVFSDGNAGSSSTRFFYSLNVTL